MDGKFFGPPHAKGGLPVIHFSTASDAVDYLIQFGLRKMLEDVNAGLEQLSAYEQETLEILDFFKRNPTANRAYAGDFEEGTAVSRSWRKVIRSAPIRTGGSRAYRHPRLFGI